MPTIQAGSTSAMAISSTADTELKVWRPAEAAGSRSTTSSSGPHRTEGPSNRGLGHSAVPLRLRWAWVAASPHRSSWAGSHALRPSARSQRRQLARNRCRHLLHRASLRRHDLGSRVLASGLQLIRSDRCQVSSFRSRGKVDGTRSLRRRVTLISAGCPEGQSRMTVLRREGTLSRPRDLGALVSRVYPDLKTRTKARTCERSVRVSRNQKSLAKSAS
jgi:hypothetical protein